MPYLAWRLFNNPLYDTASKLFIDLEHMELEVANFTTLANGGFGDGTITIKNPSDNLIQNVLDHALMKRVTASDGAGRIAFEGFIAEVHATMNHQVFVRSMDDFSNRVIVQYKYMGAGCAKSASCNGKRIRNESDVSDSLRTQTEYGIKEAWIDVSGNGTITNAIATDIGEMYLKKSLRARSIDFSLGTEETRPNSLTFIFWGYYSTLQWRSLNRNVATNTDIGTIISTTLAYGKNISSHLTYGGVAPFISTDRSGIATIGRNTRFNRDAKWMLAQDFIQGVIQGGDIDGKELFFQILEDRKPKLYARPNSPHYYSNYDFSRVWNADHKLIPSYMVRAGGYITSENINESADPINDVLQRKRVSLVEQTSYDDITGQLDIPPPQSVITPDRLFARAIRKAHRGH